MNRSVFVVLAQLHKQGNNMRLRELLESVEDGRAFIKQTRRPRPDGSTEVRYHILDGNGVTRKIFDDSKNAKAWLSANRDLLDKD